MTVTNGFARFAYGLLLPAMQFEIGWNYAQAGWLKTANALGYVVGEILTMLLIRCIGNNVKRGLGILTAVITLSVRG